MSGIIKTNNQRIVSESVIIQNFRWKYSKGFITTSNLETGEKLRQAKNCTITEFRRYMKLITAKDLN